MQLTFLVDNLRLPHPLHVGVQNVPEASAHEVVERISDMLDRVG